MTDTATKPDAVHLAAIGPWLTSPPTEDGWYWAMHQNNSGPWMAWVDADDQNLRRGQGVYCVMGYKSEIEAAGFLVEHFTHWLGPLPRPELPT